MDPAAFYAELTDNAAAVQHDRVSWDTFSARNREIWARIERAGEATKDAVLTLLRADLPAC